MLVLWRHRWSLVMLSLCLRDILLGDVLLLIPLLRVLRRVLVLVVMLVWVVWPIVVWLLRIGILLLVLVLPPGIIGRTGHHTSSVDAASSAGLAISNQYSACEATADGTKARTRLAF
jgi:hypothetical protein